MREKERERGTTTYLLPGTSRLSVRWGSLDIFYNTTIPSIVKTSLGGKLSRAAPNLASGAGKASNSRLLHH